MITTFMTIDNNYCDLCIGPLCKTLWTYGQNHYDLTVTINGTYGHILCDYEDSNYFLTNSLIIFVFCFFFTDVSSVIVFVKYNGRLE